MSLSGAVKCPRLSDSGVTFSMASIVSIGSIRSRFEEAYEYASALIKILMATMTVVHKFSLDEIRTQSIQRGTFSPATGIPAFLAQVAQWTTSRT
jgi:hypothetical protein